MINVDGFANIFADTFRQKMGLRITGVTIKDSEGTGHPPDRKRVVVEFEEAPPIVIYIDAGPVIPFVAIGNEPRWETMFGV
jgi:hypothetical protein